jgi:prepilin-type N-terminal cleavage/methylation domain-containing protein
MRGFSLVELLIALLIALTVAGATFGLMNQAQAMFAVQAELPDMQQRLRVAADALGRDLLMTGSDKFPSIVPHRRGIESPDVPGTFRRDCISLLSMPAFAVQTTLEQPTDGSGVVLVKAQTGCPAGNPLCGFRAGMLAIVLDDTRAYDLFRISGVASDPPALMHAGFTLSKMYPAGATIAQAHAATYWLEVDPRANVSQLMRYDGDETDLPLVDNVAALQFEYFADSLTQIDESSLTDGPWLPDAVFANRFDADVLRVRRVRATVRVRANQTFLHVPLADQTIHVEIAPRSQNRLP